LLDDITEPILSPLRQVVPRLGMFDITPIIAIIILRFIPYIFSVLVGFLR
jgi:YggT family protein